MGRKILTGQDVQFLPEGATLDLTRDTIITDVAREWIERKRLKIEYGESGALPNRERVRVAIGSDHAGYEMKEALRELLEDLETSYLDYGTHSTQSVDYPDFAHKVARAVAFGHAELGIIIDGGGIGSAMAANKVPGARAAWCPDESTARDSRELADANILTLGARHLSKEVMKKVVRTFLTASITEDCHRARVSKIMEIEQRYRRNI